MTNNIDSILYYSQYENVIYRKNMTWEDNSQRDNIIIFDDTLYSAERGKKITFWQIIR